MKSVRGKHQYEAGDRVRNRGVINGMVYEVVDVEGELTAVRLANTNLSSFWVQNSSICPEDPNMTPPR